MNGIDRFLKAILWSIGSIAVIIALWFISYKLTGNAFTLGNALVAILCTLTLGTWGFILIQKILGSKV